MKKYIFIAMIAVCNVLFISAQNHAPVRVPAYPGVIERIQPNKDTVHVYLRGDEWSHFMMTTDGYQVQERDNGKICYCKLKRDGSVKVTCRQAHDAAHRSRSEQRWLDKHGINKLKE